MFEIRDMQILAALAKHRHFARAASEVGISQPAFSARLGKLELTLGVPLVERGNRFKGFTPEGEAALGWARQVLDAAQGLQQGIEEAKGAVRGRLIIGVVPTALAFAAQIPLAMKAAHPGIAIEIHSATSLQIRVGVEDSTFDAGITYGDDVLPAALRFEPLYEERYVLLAPRGMIEARSDTLTWQEAAELPLSVLTPDMQNRHILTEIFDSVGAVPNIVLETNSFLASLIQAQNGFAATIVPETLVETLGAGDEVESRRLIKPEAAKPIGIMSVDRQPAMPAIRALLSVLDTIHDNGRLSRKS